MPKTGDPGSFAKLPEDLPVPVDDGAADHLTGLGVPSVTLIATTGKTVDLSSLEGRTVVYAYPKTGRPGVALPDGWDGIPGARGCTPQSCAFRDHHADLTALGVGAVFGMSSQTPGYQGEVATRLHLPFPLLSDHDGTLRDRLRLPSFEVQNETLLKRLTMILRDGVIETVFYPVFPPDRNASDVLAWLQANPA